MVQSNKFRGVRQRQWGSWVSEIRHPLLKKRIWLGTFETAEEAARAYDEASILLSGQNAKTNFPVVPSTTTGKDPSSKLSDNNILGAKLRKCCKNPSASSITCLRLDNDSSNIGVWQKRAGKDSASYWVTKIELKKNIIQTQIIDEAMDEENKVAMQMVEELLDLNNNIPAPPLSLINNIGVINYESN